MSARLTAAGYRIVQHTGIHYFLGLSPQQDSILRTVGHQRRLGQPAAYILFHPGVSAGAFGRRAGGNRRRRSLLRLMQVVNVAAWAWALSSAVRRRRTRMPVTVGLAASVGRQVQMQMAQGVVLTARDRFALIALQPAWDVAWVSGFAEGVWRVVVERVRGSAVIGRDSE